MDETEKKLSDIDFDFIRNMMTAIEIAVLHEMAWGIDALAVLKQEKED